MQRESLGISLSIVMGEEKTDVDAIKLRWVYDVKESEGWEG
jgi:hypothetical protein